MSKKITSLFLIALLLVITTLIPTCANKCIDSFETSVTIDSDNHSNETIKRLELQFIYSIGISIWHITIKTQSNLVYLYKIYTSVYNKRESPPPEKSYI
ncbi:MAG: hypothetical protein ACK5H1_02225 [Tenacibaculum sp.]